jgi:hypothetical protein
VVNGGRLALGETSGERMYFEGSVRDLEGKPVGGAVVNIVSLSSLLLPRSFRSVPSWRRLMTFT